MFKTKNSFILQNLGAELNITLVLLNSYGE